MSTRGSLPGRCPLRPTLTRQGLFLVLLGCVSACQRPPEGLAQAPLFYSRVVRAEPVPAPRISPAPSAGDFASFAGETSVYFEGDSIELGPEARGTLDRQAEWLTRNPGITASLQGHTDILGGRARQFAIGEMRATAMRRYLVAKGVEPARLEITSFGRQRPQGPELDETVQRLNRRGDTILRGVAGQQENPEGN